MSEGWNPDSGAGGVYQSKAFTAAHDVRTWRFTSNTTLGFHRKSREQAQNQKVRQRSMYQIISWQNLLTAISIQHALKQLGGF